jgi:fructose-1,6-bisphosphatase II
VIIGEGEKDEAPMLYNGEVVGDGSAPHVDIAVDPVEGTTLTATGRGGATSIIAVSEQGSMLDPGPCVYMEKIAVGPEAAGVVDIRATVKENLAAVAKAKGLEVSEITAMVLDRPRHAQIVDDIRSAGARIRLIGDGDAPGAISTAIPEAGVDILFGIGGTPEGVIAAAALKCLGGELVGRLYARDDAERAAAIEFGHDLDKVLRTDDLVASDNCFFAATGITDGNLLKGVHYTRQGASTQSLVMRSRSGTVRFVDAIHKPEKFVG